MIPPNKIDFKNTKAVFSHLRNWELVKQTAMFYGMSVPWLNVVAKRVMSKKGSGFTGIRGLLKRTVFKHFCGGETVEQSNKAIAQLWSKSIGTILDYSAEGEETEEFFELTTTEVVKTIEASATNKAIGMAVFKVTGIARMELLEKLSTGATLTPEEDGEYESIKSRVLIMCRAAYEKNLPILVDAEHSWIQPAIDRIAESMMELFNKDKAIVYNTFQLYRHDRLAYLEQSLEKAAANGYKLGAKMVRGAYMEKENQRAVMLNYPSPIQTNKESTDRDFDAALARCISRLNNCSICVGTHNEKSCALLVQLMENHSIAFGDERVCVAQLKGMSDHISGAVANTGIRTFKYVPYGPLVKVIPYLLRRIDENKSVAGEASRELHIRFTELKNRFSSFIHSFKNQHYDNNKG